MVDRCWHWPMVSMILIDFEYLQGFGGSLLSSLKSCQVIESRNMLKRSYCDAGADWSCSPTAADWCLFCGCRTLRKVLRNAFRRGILSDNSLLVVQGWGISAGLFSTGVERNERLGNTSRGLKPQKFQEISTNPRGMKAKHSKYSQILFSHLYIIHIYV
jgi:hypothetical protein